MVEEKTKLDSFYPYEFNKSDKLTGMRTRDGCYFMQLLMDEFKGKKEC